MKPLFENVLVKVDDLKEIDTGGYTSVQKEREVTTGTVVSVGPGTIEWPKMSVKDGDRVKWHRNAGSRVNLNGAPHIILSERKREIIAVL